MIDRTRNVVQFPTVTRAEQPKRSTWSRLCSLPDDLDTAIAQLHDHPYQPADDDADEPAPAAFAQETALYATVDHGDRKVWHQVVGWQWHERSAAYVPLLAVVDEQVTCSMPVYAYYAGQPLRFHPELPSRHIGNVARLVS